MVISVFEINIESHSGMEGLYAKLVPIDGKAQRQWVGGNGTPYDPVVQRHLDRYSKILSMELDFNTTQNEPQAPKDSIDEMVLDDPTTIGNVGELNHEELSSPPTYEHHQPLGEATIDYATNDEVRALGRVAQQIKKGEGYDMERFSDLRNIIIEAHTRAILWKLKNPNS